MSSRRKKRSRAGSRRNEESVKSVGRRKRTVGLRATTMVLIAQAQQLKAKLNMLKGKHHPAKMVNKKLPDGAGLLASVPEIRTTSVDDGAAEQEFCAAIDRISNVFGRQRRAREHGCRAQDVHAALRRLRSSEEAMAPL